MSQSRKQILQGFLFLYCAVWGLATGQDVKGQQKPNALNYYGKDIDVFRLFGQKNVVDAGRNKVSPRGIYHAAGVMVDTSGVGDNIYVVDTGNSRILGFRMTGPFANPPLTGRKIADLVLGQPDFESSNCNGDSNLGFTKPPTASTLCLLGYPLANNTAEAWQRINLDVDSAGNLYLPDIFNNRILKFNQPFAKDRSNGRGDTIADYVWGQDSFTTNLRNGTSLYEQPLAPTANSLWISNSGGVASEGVSVDQDGSVWAADTNNSRILRFRQNTKAADLVIGQAGFNEPRRDCQGVAPALNQLCKPTLARINPMTGDLYVLDEYGEGYRARILVFRPPFSNGMSAFKTFVPNQGGPFQNWGAFDGQGTYVFQSSGFIFNRYRVGEYAAGEIWINEHQAFRTLLTDFDGNIVKVIGSANQFLRGGDQAYAGCRSDIYTGNHAWWPGGTIGMDKRNKIYFADEFFSTVFQYSLPYQIQNYNGHSCLPDASGILLPKGPNQRSDDRLGEAVGMAVHGNQLLVNDEGSRLKVYNNYQNKVFGAPPDFVLWGYFQTRSRFAHAIDDNNRIWLMGGNDLRIFQLPFTSGADVPLVSRVRLFWADNDEEISNFFAGSIAFDPINHAIYITDATGTRILRVRNYSDLNHLKVDLVLGQIDKSGIQCNRGLNNPTASTLCRVSQIKFDRLGNLFVVDNDYECQGNRRIVMFRAQDLAIANIMFPDISATKVFNSESMTQIGECAYWTVNRPGSPVSIAFNSRNEMVVGNDGYYGYQDTAHRSLRQLWLYRDPINRQTPDASIDLYLGTPGELDFDVNDNLLVQDHTWYRVMMINLDTDPEWLVPVP